MPVDGGGAWPGFKPMCRAAEQRPGPTGVEGAGGPGGHGRASRRGAERSEALASRAAGASGARNTRGATSKQAGRPPIRRDRRAWPRCRWAAAGPGGHSQLQASPDWRPPRGLRGLAGLRDDAPSHTSATRRRRCGDRRVACGAWPGFEPTRRAKLAARTASGRAGHAAAGDQAGLQGDQAGLQAAR